MARYAHKSDSFKERVDSPSAWPTAKFARKTDGSSVSWRKSLCIVFTHQSTAERCCPCSKPISLHTVSQYDLSMSAIKMTEDFSRSRPPVSQSGSVYSTSRLEARSPWNSVSVGTQSLASLGNLHRDNLSLTQLSVAHLCLTKNCLDHRSQLNLAQCSLSKM